MSSLRRKPDCWSEPVSAAFQPVIRCFPTTIPQGFQHEKLPSLLGKSERFAQLLRLLFIKICRTNTIENFSNFFVCDSERNSGLGRREKRRKRSGIQNLRKKPFWSARGLPPLSFPQRERRQAAALQIST